MAAERLQKKWPVAGVAQLYDALIAIGWLRDGKHEAHGQVTLTANSATTTLSDRRIGLNSKVVFSATTANAAAELGGTAFYHNAPGDGTVVLNHANNANTDRILDYIIAG